jgi:DNA-binding NarL/FixJ family response regulator
VIDFLSVSVRRSVSVKKILVIDDHEPMRRNVLMILEMEGFKPLSADNGRKGLELARKERPDLILCDITMPQMDGYAVLQALRDNKETATIPFIFLTARGEKLDVRVGMNYGADDYLSKPVGHEELLAAIAARLERKRFFDESAQEQVANVKLAPDFASPMPLHALGLTAREAEILLWVAQGKGNGDIAIITGTSEKTVKNHMTHVFEKLGVESRNAATVRALEVLSVPMPRPKAPAQMPARDCRRDGM